MFHSLMIRWLIKTFRPVDEFFDFSQSFLNYIFLSVLPIFYLIHVTSSSSGLFTVSVACRGKSDTNIYHQNLNLKACVFSIYNLLGIIRRTVVLFLLSVDSDFRRETEHLFVNTCLYCSCLRVSKHWPIVGLF